MNIKRILSNDLSVLMARSNEGKTMALCQIIDEYKKNYSGDIWTFGLKEELVEKLGVESFSSLPELETIKESIIIIDELLTLFDFSDKHNRKAVENVMRMVNHNGNKILLCGLPSDFNKYVSAKAKCFLFKGLNITDLINGAKTKQVVKDYKGVWKGEHKLNVPIDKMLCFDGFYWEETVHYNIQYDTKVDNKDLFKKVTEKVDKKVRKKVEKNGITYY